MADKKLYDYVAKKNLFIAIPAIILSAAIIMLVIFGLEVSIEFRGGTIITYSYTGEIDFDDVTALITEKGVISPRISSGTAFGTDAQTLTLAFSSGGGLDSEQQDLVTELMVDRFSDNNLKHEGSQDVSPTTGFKFFLKCLVAVGFSFIILVIYIAFRFKKIGGWSAGVFALVALMTDVFMVITTFIFFRFSIDANFMAVVLTILGYSINNTIVVYDRIRENRSLHGLKITYRELVNKSVKQSIVRSVNTTITTAAAVAVICVVAMVCGVNSILSFAFPMLVGLGSGMFSSLCLAGPLWVVWQEHKIKKSLKSAKTA